MKSSYFTTPRTLNDCQFITSADPYQAFKVNDSGWLNRFLLAVGIVLLIAVPFIVQAALS